MNKYVYTKASVQLKKHQFDMTGRAKPLMMLFNYTNLQTDGVLIPTIYIVLITGITSRHLVHSGY